MQTPIPVIPYRIKLLSEGNASISVRKQLKNPRNAPIPKQTNPRH